MRRFIIVSWDHMDHQVALTNLTSADLRVWLRDLGEPAYRAQQLEHWLYVELVSTFDEMLNLPLELRQQLKKVVRISTLQPLAERVSDDHQTEKVLFQLADGQTIESVLMRYDERQTVCVSTQVGCAIGCGFCATGQSGFERDLSAGEIIDQVLHFARQLAPEALPITNVVVMGMGEPFFNYEATWQAIATLHDPEGFNLGARRFTISTAGVVPGIERLSKQALQVGLAVSLHAPNNGLRDQLVPLNRRYPLEDLIPACRRYVEQTGRRITFEYALINQLNDSPEHAQQLASLIRGMPSHVNLIPLNPYPGSRYQASSRERVTVFQQTLEQAHVATTLRLRRGMDIQAGCGQLRSSQQARTDTNSS